MSLWERFKADFVERFLNFETAKGVYLIPAGGIIIYVGIYHIQFVIQAVCVVVGWYMISEGARKIFVNRIKQAAKSEDLLEKRIVLNEMRKAAAPETKKAPIQ